MITFRALGPPDLRGPDGTQLQSILARPKLLGLLSVLASAPRGGFHRRDTLLGLFWRDTDQKRGRRALRQALYYLRQSLGEGVLTGRGDEEIGLDPDHFWCDFGAFGSALERGDAEEALELYRGDLLTGFFVSGAPEFERWLAERREELRRQACTAAWELADRAGSDGNAAAAGHWAYRATSLAPFDEGLVRQAIVLLDRLGDRAGAVRLYEALTGRLEDELGLQPSPETRELVEEIRARTEVRGKRIDHGGVGTAADGPAAAVEPTRSEVEPAVGPATGEAAPEPRRERPALRGKGFRLGVVVGVGLAILVGLVWAFRSDAPTLDPERVVVAVFDNQTGTPELDPLGRMAADWITQGIAESGLIDVVPSTVGLSLRSDLLDREATATGGMGLAESTGAGTLVAGAYYRRGDSVELQAQVIDARHGRLLSAVAPSRGSLDDPGAALDSLRRGVVRTLAVLLEPSLRASDVAHPPSLAAYREYLEGHRAFERSNDMREAAKHFYRALELDSTFAVPRFYLVFSHYNLREPALADSNAQLLDARRAQLNEYQRNTLDWQMAILRGDQMAALRAARARGGIDIGVQALRTNRPRETIDVLADAEAVSRYYFHWLALTEAYHMLGDYPRELREVRRGQDWYPDRLRVAAAELRALAAMGRIEEVERRLGEILQLPQEEVVTPVSVMLETAAELRAHGSRQASFDVIDRAIEWFRSRPPGEATGKQYWKGLAVAFYQRERWEDARLLFERLAAEDPTDMDVQGYLGSLAARHGDREQAKAISDALEGRTVPLDFGRSSYWQASIAALLGERDQTMVLLRRAYAQGRMFSVYLHADMNLDPLQDYPPFQEFIRPRG